MDNIYIPSFSYPFTTEQIHLLINRCDTLKDAAKASGAPKIQDYELDGSLFGRALDALFPKPQNFGNNTKFVKILESMEETILSGKFQAGALGLDPESFVTLKMDKALKSLLRRDMKKSQKAETELDFEEQSLPSTYRYAFHDAGESPYFIQSGIKNILTPGSYIDPGPRDTNGDREPKYNGRLTDHSQYGFSDMTFGWKWNSDNTCTVDITMPSHNIEIHDNRDTKHNHIGPPPDYFGGNKTKNIWFNEISSDILTAKKYLLGKELGDTLQVTFTRLLFDNPGSVYNDSTSCIFSNDMVVAMRAKLLKLPCCIKEYGPRISGERHRRMLFFRPLTDPMQLLKSRNKLLLEECVKHNNATKVAITRIFTAGFYIGNNEYSISAPPPRSTFPNKYLNPFVKGYLRSIIAIIDHINTAVLENTIKPTIETAPQPEEEFRQLIAFCKINHLFKLRRKSKTDYELILTVRNLFPSDIPAMNPIYASFLQQFQIDSVYRSNRTDIEEFGDLLLSPGLDIFTNFMYHNMSGKPTIYDQLNFLMMNKTDAIRQRIQEAIQGSAPASPASPPPLVATSQGGKPVSILRNIRNNRAKKSHTALSKVPRKVSIIVAPIATFDAFRRIYELDTPISGLTHLYDEDAMELLWSLYQRLRIGARMESIDRMGYMEDFLFFLYPYFQFVGETCFEIEHLQAMHDMFYITGNYPFTAIMRYYVQRVYLPRNQEFRQSGEVVLRTNQDVFLAKFMSGVVMPARIFSAERRRSAKRKTAKAAKAAKLSRRPKTRKVLVTRSSSLPRIQPRPITTGLSTMV